jgi:uncharacterized RDD family membrane protein YckC
MNEQFYIAENGQQIGPFTIEELKIKKIQRDTLVWTAGLADWTKAEKIPVLQNLLIASPPPLPKTSIKNTTDQNTTYKTPVGSSINSKYYGYELARRRERFFASFIEGIIITIPFILLFGIDKLNGIETYSFGSIVGSAILSAIFGAIFYPIWGGNLGHKIMGLKVISSENGEIQNNPKTGALRESLKSLFGLVFIPVIWLLWDDNKQNLYDKVVKTYVVKNRNN